MKGPSLPSSVGTSSPIPSLIGESSTSTSINPKRISLKQKLARRLDRAIHGKPKSGNGGWVIRPDLLFEMQIQNRGGNAGDLLKKVGARRDGAGEIVGSSGEGGSSRNKNQVQEGIGRKTPQTWAEVEAVMYM